MPQLHFSERELSSSCKWPLRGLSRLMGLHQAAGMELGDNLSNGIVMVSWPWAESDLDSTGSLVLSGFFLFLV